jgi:hypothetical protein
MKLEKRTGLLTYDLADSLSSRLRSDNRAVQLVAYSCGAVADFHRLPDAFPFT